MPHISSNLSETPHPATTLLKVSTLFTKMQLQKPDKIEFLAACINYPIDSTQLELPPSPPAPAPG